MGSRREGIRRAGGDEKQSPQDLDGSAGLRMVTVTCTAPMPVSPPACSTVHHGCREPSFRPVRNAPESTIRMFRQQFGPRRAPDLHGYDPDLRSAGASAAASSPAARGGSMATGAEGARGALLQSRSLARRPNRSVTGRPDQEGREPSGEEDDAAMLTRAFTMEAHPRPC